MRIFTLFLLLLSPACFPAVAQNKLALASARTGRQQDVAVGPSDAIFAHVVDGASWKTTFILTNLTSTSTQFVIFFDADDGTSMSLPITGLGNTRAVYGAIPAKGTVTLETDGTNDQLKQGSAFFFCLDRPYDQSGAQAVKNTVGGMAIFALRVPGNPDAEAVVPVSSLSDSQLMFPFDNAGGFVTSIALINGDVVPGVITVVMRNPDGTLIGQDTFTLAANNKIAFAVPDKYPQTRGKRGSLEVSTTAVALGGLGLRFGPNGSFTSMHPLSVPAPEPTQPSGSVPVGGSALSCSALEGGLIFGSDGRFLGRMTTNTYATDAIGNTYGNYGSLYSSTSIYNAYSTYGSAFSQLSPFNSFATAPPIVFIGSTAVAYLTMNQTKTPRIDPTLLGTCRFRL